MRTQEGTWISPLLVDQIGIMKITNRSISAGLFIAIIAVASLPLSVIHAATLSRQLEIGMSGSDVSALQTFLASDPVIYPEGLVTGYFGSLTQAAVARYQTKKGLPSVGRVGPLTLAAIGNLADDGRKVGTDRMAPTISNVSVNTDNSSISFEWNTSEPSAAIVYYDTSPLALREADAMTGIGISGATALESTNVGTSHDISITNLRSNTTYYYALYVRDASGNVSITWPESVRTN